MGWEGLRMDQHRSRGLDPVIFGPVDLGVSNHGLPLEAFSSQARLVSSQSVHTRNCQEVSMYELALETLVCGHAHGVHLFLFCPHISQSFLISFPL